MDQPDRVIDLAILRVEEPVVGPGERTTVRVHVLNSGTAAAHNVTVALSDGTEKGPDGIALRDLGDMPPFSVKATTLSLDYAIADAVRLAALNVAVFVLSQPLVIDGIRRSATIDYLPMPVASRSVRG